MCFPVLGGSQPVPAAGPGGSTSPNTVFLLRPHAPLSAVRLEALQGLYICKHLPGPAAPQRAHSANRSSHPRGALTRAAEVTWNLFPCIRELVMCAEEGSRGPSS